MCYRLLNILCIFGLLTTSSTMVAQEEASKTPKEDQDALYRKQIIGTWEDEYQGKRTMKVKADGTATMIVELSGIKAALYASRLEFDMVWSIENGRLKKRTTGGRPAGRVNFVLKMMGDRVDEPILELTSERLLLLDANGKTKYDWRRVKKPEGDKKS
jgi:hypothetical protein